jgi:hypothetical protein
MGQPARTGTGAMIRQSLGSVRGRPKRASSPWSPKRVTAQTRSPRKPSTRMLPARQIGAHGSGR